MTTYFLADPASEDKRPDWIKVIVGNVHYLHFGCILLVLTMLVTVAVSLLTEPIPEKCVSIFMFPALHTQLTLR